MEAPRSVRSNDIVSFFQQRQQVEATAGRSANYYQRCIDAVQGHWSEYQTAEEARVAEESRGRGAITREEREMAARLAREVSPVELEAAMGGEQARAPRRRRKPQEAEQPELVAAQPRRRRGGKGAAAPVVGAAPMGAAAAAVAPERAERARAALDQFEADATQMQAAFHQLPRDVQDVLLDMLPLEARMFFENLQGLEDYARGVVGEAARRRRTRILGPHKEQKLQELAHRNTVGGALKLLAVSHNGIRRLINNVSDQFQRILRNDPEAAADAMNDFLLDVDADLPGWLNPRVVNVSYLVQNGDAQYPVAYPSEDVLAEPQKYNDALAALAGIVEPLAEQSFESNVDMTVATARNVDETALHAEEQLQGALLQGVMQGKADTVTNAELNQVPADFSIIKPFGPIGLEGEADITGSPVERMQVVESPPPTPSGAGLAGGPYYPSVPPSPAAGAPYSPVAPPTPRATPPQEAQQQQQEADENAGYTAPEPHAPAANVASAVERAHSVADNGPLNNYNAVVQSARLQPPDVQQQEGWVHPYGYAGADQPYEIKRIVGKPFWSIQDVRAVLTHLYGAQRVNAMSTDDQRALFQQIYEQTTSRFDRKYTGENLAEGWSLIVNMARANDDTAAAMRALDQAAVQNRLDVSEMLRTVFRGALRYVGKQGPVGHANGIRIIEASDPAQFEAWRRSRGGNQALANAGRSFYKLCGSVDTNEEVVAGGLTVQPVVSEEVVLNLVAQPNRRALGFRVYFAITDDTEQELLGFLQTVDLARHAEAVKQGEAAPMLLQLRTNEQAFKGDAQLPAFDADEVIMGAETRTVLAPDNRPNRLAQSLFVDYICTKTHEIYEGREVQITDTWFDEQNRAWALIIDPGRPDASRATPADHLRPVAVPRDQIRHTSPYMYVGHLLLLQAMLNEMQAGHYGLMLTVSPKGFFNLFYEEPMEGPLVGQQGAIAETEQARRHAIRGNIFDSNLVSMYQRYWHLERAITWENLSRDTGLVWLQQKRPSSGKQQVLMQGYAIGKPVGAANVYKYRLRGTHHNPQTGEIVHESQQQAVEFERVSDVLVPHGIMYRPFPTVHDLASFIGQLGASIISAIVPPSAPQRTTSTQALMQQLPVVHQQQQQPSPFAPMQ